MPVPRTHKNLRTHRGDGASRPEGAGPRNGLRATVRAQLAAHVADMRADRVDRYRHDSLRAISGADKLVGR